MRVCVCACVRACVRACVCVCVEIGWGEGEVIANESDRAHSRSPLTENRLRSERIKRPSRHYRMHSSEKIFSFLFFLSRNRIAISKDACEKHLHHKDDANDKQCSPRL